MVPKYLKRGYALFCLDEATFCIQPNIARGWFAKNQQPVQIFSHNRQKFHAFGAHGHDKTHYMFSDKINSHYFLKFIKRLHKKYAKLLFVLDNVPWHKTKKLKRFFHQHRSTFRVEFLPTYSPELNPIEQWWKKLKQSAANQLFHDKTELKKYLHKQAKKTKNRVKTFEYLCP